MLQSWAVVITAFAYIGLLFLIASLGDKGARLPRGRSVFIYPLSLAIYCTSWTFFGSVGLATRSSIEFLAIYLGPILMIGLCTPLLLRVIRLAKNQNTTSIADFIAARYGKSQNVAALVALIALIGSLPYIALQLKSVSATLETIITALGNSGGPQPVTGDIALIVTVAMALFAVLFGTRHTDATEHQNGLMLAIAAESIVKLVAFLTAGIFVTFWVFGPFELFAKAWETPAARAAIEQPPSLANLVVMTLLAFFAIMLLPRQFHVGVVENHSEAEVARARWLFPAYLVAINLFVIPITLAGLITFPTDSMNSDMYVLALPIAAGSPTIAVLVFIGGLSAATAMVIVECVALAIMMSNDLVMPLLLKYRASLREAAPQDATGTLLNIRRVAIFSIMVLAYLYFRVSTNAQLASIGLLSFAAVAQFAPAFFGGLFWRRANARGAIAGMMIGFIMWFYTLMLPNFVDAGLIGADLIEQGPFHLAWLRPQAIFGIEATPLIHGVAWSLGLNLLAYVALSLTRESTSIERLQADLFVPPRLAPATTHFRPWRSVVTVGDLITTVSQYLGADRTKQSFEATARARGMAVETSAPADFQMMDHAERLIASAIGAASSRLVMSLLLRKRAVSPKAAIKLLDDAHAALHYNREILQTALDHMRQGVAVFNRELELICCNRQFGDMLDLPLQAVQVGAPLRDILHIFPDGDNPDSIERRLAIFTAEGQPHLERLSKQGLVVEVRADRMPDGGLVITFSDITPSVEAAEALERANASLERRVRERTEELTRLNSELARAKSNAEAANISKTRFLAAASHDILQPLNAARLYATSLVERESGHEAARLAGNIDQSLESIEDILGALLEISRLDAGAQKPALTSFPLQSLMHSLEIEFAPLARQRDLELTVVPTTVVVTSDRLLLRRLLQNLIANAIKYTPEGHVLVGCRRRGQSLRIDVYDTGLGIPRSKRSEIFKEFHRLDQGARMARGLGLGLSIVERIARVLNHGLALESEVGHGSHFSVTVPLAHKITHVVTPVAMKHPLPMSGACVVCIDNEPAILDGMRTLLTGWGASAICATNGAEAIKMLQQSREQPTGLLVDYHLDQGNGFEAITDIRQTLHHEVPAILITADRSLPLREAAQAAGILILPKPVKIATLRAALGRWRSQQLAATEITAAE